MPPNPTGPTNAQLRMLIRFLRKAATQNSAPIWRRVAEILERPRRRRVAVNVGKLGRVASEGQVVVVPGKVLAGGFISKKLTVAAFSISPTAAGKLAAAGCEVLTIPELVRRNPRGSGVVVVT